MDNVDWFIDNKIVWVEESENIMKDINDFNRKHRNDSMILLFNDETENEIYEYCLYCMDPENLTIVYAPEKTNDKIKYSVLKNLYKGVVIVDEEIVHITPPKIFVISDSLPNYKKISSKKIYINE